MPIWEVALTPKRCLRGLTPRTTAARLECHASQGCSPANNACVLHKAPLGRSQSRRQSRRSSRSPLTTDDILEVQQQCPQQWERDKNSQHCSRAQHRGTRVDLPASQRPCFTPENMPVADHVIRISADGSSTSNEEMRINLYRRPPCAWYSTEWPSIQTSLSLPHPLALSVHGNLWRH